MSLHRDGAVLEALRLVWITDGLADCDRIVMIAEEAFAAGLSAIQVREPGLSPRQLWRLCEDLRSIMLGRGLLLINDRIELAVSGLVDGVHLGGQSMPWVHARAILPEGCLLGCSTHNESELVAAVDAGADYVSLSPVFTTRCKPGVEVLGVETALRLSAEVPIPVLWLGGIDTDRLGQLRQKPYGVAVRSALGSAEDVAATTTALSRLIFG